MQVYADNAATTPMREEAVNAMLNTMKIDYGNPSSIHKKGQEAAKILFDSRTAIAALLNADEKEIFFTSGGTEADNWAINSGAELGARKNKRHIISSAFEHHAVLHTLERLNKQGFEITLLDVHEDGVVRPDELAAAIREDTALVTIMYANNEIGTVQPIKELAAICREKGILFHTDAVQAGGHLPLDVKSENIDMLSLSAHKFNGPKGVGLLYCRKNISLPPFMNGGAQERGKRGGTESVPAIASMASALAASCREMAEEGKKLTAMRDKLIAALIKIPHSRLNGAGANRLPGMANFCFEGIEGESLLLMLDMAGICASSGSACTSGSLDPSHVLLALGLSHETAHGSLRISLGKFNTMEEIDYIIETLPPIVERLRLMSPTWEKIMKGY